MPTARYALTAVLGADRRIYAIGGTGPGGIFLPTLEVYDPGMNSWVSLAPMPTARSGLTAVLGPDGRIYAIGGVSTGNAPLQTVEAYDPRTNSWTSLTPMPRSEYGPTAGGNPLAYVEAELSNSRNVHREARA